MPGNVGADVVHKFLLFLQQKLLELVKIGGQIVDSGVFQFLPAAVAVENADGGQTVFMGAGDVEAAVAHHDGGAVRAAAAQGMIWGLMALGVFITFRVLDIADLTVATTLPFRALARSSLCAPQMRWK